MKKIISAFLILMFTSSVFATTAILCGNPAVVDRNNHKASLHMIFDNEDSASPDEISVYFKGVDAKISAVKQKSGKLFVDLSSPKRTLVLDKATYEYSNCDSETFFNIKLITGANTTTLTKCHCFAD